MTDIRVKNSNDTFASRQLEDDWNCVENGVHDGVGKEDVKIVWTLLDSNEVLDNINTFLFSEC